MYAGVISVLHRRFMMIYRRFMNALGAPGGWCFTVEARLGGGRGVLAGASFVLSLGFGHGGMLSAVY